MAALQKALDGLDQELPDGSTQKLATLLSELERWNRKFNLTAVRDRAQMVTLHVQDSLVARRFLEGRQILDVGWGLS